MPVQKGKGGRKADKNMAKKKKSEEEYGINSMPRRMLKREKKEK